MLQRVAFGFFVISLSAMLAHAAPVTFNVTADTTGTNIGYNPDFATPAYPVPSIVSPSWLNGLTPGDKIVYTVTVDDTLDLTTAIDQSNGNGGDPTQTITSWADSAAGTATLYDSAGNVISTTTGVQIDLSVLHGSADPSDTHVTMDLITTTPLGDGSNQVTDLSTDWYVPNSAYTGTQLHNIFTPGLSAGLTPDSLLLDYNDASSAQSTLIGFDDAGGSVVISQVPAPMAMAAVPILGSIGIALGALRRRWA